MIQDLGFYPFSSTEFSDLSTVVHYVRSGDFAHELAGREHDYAFALEALTHYAANFAGHLAVTGLFPSNIQNCGTGSAAQLDMRRIGRHI